MFMFLKQVQLPVITLLCTLLMCINCLQQDELHRWGIGKKNDTEKTHKVSPQMRADMILHGFLLWSSMGIFTPVGMLAIRMSTRTETGSIHNRVLFYLHVLFQTLSAVVATAGAALSLRKFENSFDNNHQRIGLALYGAIWVQTLIGFFRPHRGKKERTYWYLVHWILGTVISLVGIINIYTGLRAFSKRTSKSTLLWTILFTAQVSVIGFFYLLQDKFDYMKKQGMILGIHAQRSSIEDIPSQRESQKELHVPEASGKTNALQNLFD